jgi:hypothetical protein
MLRFVVLEMTPEVQPIESYHVIGEVEIPLGRILIHDSLVEAGRDCDVRVSAAQPSRWLILAMIVAFVGLPKSHWLQRNYPQLLVCKQLPGRNNWISVHETEIIKRSDTGQWQPISISCRLICDNDLDRSIRFFVRDSEPILEMTEIR